MRSAGHPRVRALALAMGSAGCLASPPSSSPGPGEDGGGPSGRLTAIAWEAGGQISDTLFAHADGRQGTLLLWIELGPDLSALDSRTEVAHVSGLKVALDPRAESVIARLDEPGPADEIVAGVDEWGPGTNHLITFRWDSVSTLGDLKHVSLRVDGGEAVYGVDAPFAALGPENGQLISAGTRSEDGPVVVRSAFILRRPIRDDDPPSGVYLGVADEHEAIFEAGVDGDPTLVFGSWDVVFGLSPHGDPVTEEPFRGWSHPFGDNLLGGGGFMLVRDLTADGWTFVDASGTLGGAAGTWLPATGTLNGGYRLENGELRQTVPNVAIGEQLLLRVVTYPVGGGALASVCVVPIGDPCTAPLYGRNTASRLLPDVLVLGYEAGADGVEVVLSMQDSDGATSRPGVVYSQAEVYRNLLVDPGFESEGGSPPPGWSASDELAIDEIAQNPGDARTGSYGLGIASVAPADAVPDAVLQEPAGMADLELYLVGGFFRRTGDDPAGITAMGGALYRQDADFGEDQVLLVPDPGSAGAWHHRFAVGKRLSGSGRTDAIGWGGTTPQRLTATALDDAYVVRLAPVDLVFTYAPPP